MLLQVKEKLAEEERKAAKSDADGERAELKQLAEDKEQLQKDRAEVTTTPSQPSPCQQY